MADDSAWGDLFAKAAGDAEDSRGETKSDFEDMLAGRLMVPDADTYPSWAVLAESWEKKCHGWQGRKDNTCRKCEQGPLQHLLITTIKSWPLQVFCSVRNLRSFAVGMVMSDYMLSTESILEKEKNSLVQKARSGQKEMVVGEAELLMEKVQTVVDRVKECSAHGNDKRTHWEAAVRLIIACDDVYYRLYYLQITGLILSGSSFFLPHPAQYFYSQTSDLNTDDLEHFLGFVMSEEIEPSDWDKATEDILAHYGIDYDDQSSTATHVLTYLHYNRLMETVKLFFMSGWMDRSSSVDQTLEALKVQVNTEDTLTRNDAVAAPILSQWRDSCRDRICNLYAYATPQVHSYRRIKWRLEEAGITEGIVEIGAGTGYIASVLQETGIKVLAWDVHPTTETSELNEYHGHSPPFCKVTRGDPHHLHKHNANYALLLCYPPPDSSMALNALQNFLRVGGSCLIHVGEFSGLTGMTEFEELLLHSLKLVDRVPCLCWGNDTAEVTVWIRKDGSESEPSLLLPCSNCGKVEATKRCRVVRHLVYCCKACFEGHTSVLAVHLAMNMVPGNVKDHLDFDDRRHFLPIEPTVPRSHGTTNQSGAVSVSSQRKKKKKRQKVQH